MVKICVEGSNGYVSCVSTDSEFSFINKVVSSHVLELNRQKFNTKNKMNKRVNVFSVSQSSYDCYRKIFFEMTEPREASVDKVGTFTVGDFIHNIYQDAFKKAGARTEVGGGKDYFDTRIRVQGFCDVVLNGKAGEIKSVSPFAWKYVAGGRDKFGNVIQASPKISHVRQLNMYLDLLGLKEGFILYVNKDIICGCDGKATCMYKITKDEPQIQQTVGRCVTVYNSIISNKVPDKVKGDECSYCNYKDRCKES